MKPSRLAVALTVALPCTELAFAHSGERAFVLLLPTGWYMFGGALAVASSFAVMALLPSGAVSQYGRHAVRLASLRSVTSLVPSALGFVALAFLIIAGYVGSRDPLDNPLPLVVWVLWWVGFTLVVALAGDLWKMLNPWRAAYRLIVSVPGLSRWRIAPPLHYPAWLGHWPAVLLFFGFAWFELIYPAPQDPQRLATAILAYAVVTLAGMVLFGEERWLDRAEAFSMFFRLVARLSPLSLDTARVGARERLVLTLGVPGRGLYSGDTLSTSAVAFVLLALASVSFDGLSRTFWWLGLLGENPLEYPGRTALMACNTAGLVGFTGMLAGAYFIAVRLGAALVAGPPNARPGYGYYILAIVPIAFGYHFAHYLPTFLVDAQYAVRSLGDPLALDWNIFGARDLSIRASFLSHRESVLFIWNMQVAAIVAVHIAAVLVAHTLALRRHGGVRPALLSQIPITALMIAYTVFGLWLLATPVAA